MKISRVTPAVLVLLLLAACAPIGPKALSTSRPLYNIAVQETESQQLLLNIVRQRYSDPVMFIDVTSITSGFNVSASTNFIGDIISSGSNNLAGTVGASAGEAPIISYAPNQGEKFVRQMLTPVDLRTVGLILQSGWSIERLFLVIGQSLDELRNSESGDAAQTRYLELLEVLSNLRELQRRGAVRVAVDPGGDGATDELLLIFSGSAVASGEYRQICGALGVSCEGEPLRLVQAVEAGSQDGDRITVSTRSLFSTLYFLANGVEVPPTDVENGVVAPGRKLAGGPFDPNDSRSKLFRVRSSMDEPDRAAVKIFYRDAWFYIADDDRDSKVTFTLLSMLMNLQSSDTAKVTPLITLPAM